MVVMNAPTAPLGERHAPLGQTLAAAIREAIVAGRYPPGERLVEGRLAEDFGVSRIPIREALRLLASEGLVSIEPRKGATVSAISPETAGEMVEVRATLEALNARLAARHRDAAALAKLGEVLEAGDRAAASGEPADLARLNDEYHDLLAEAGMNRILRDMLRYLRERTAGYFGTPRDNAAATWAEHADILKAVIAGDEDLAALLAARHVESRGRPDSRGRSTIAEL
jgi:DNA-binding GntR family transcriptional regulator